MQQAVLIFSGVLTTLLGVFLIWVLIRAFRARRTGMDGDRPSEPGPTGRGSTPGRLPTRPAP